ncbi:hypothetical protein, partial [Thiolapillus sp.]|uniref:hypothetical protein n=1 Tax=Thiolapillus sp. TaxID=2017437 RepID=UPI003AF6EC13
MEFILPIPLTHQMSLLSFGHNHLNLSSLPGAPVLHLKPWNTDFFHVSWELTSWSHRFHCIGHA